MDIHNNERQMNDKFIHNFQFKILKSVMYIFIRTFNDE